MDTRRSCQQHRKYERRSNFHEIKSHLEIMRCILITIRCIREMPQILLLHTYFLLLIYCRTWNKVGYEFMICEVRSSLRITIQVYLNISNSIISSERYSTFLERQVNHTGESIYYGYCLRVVRENKRQCRRATLLLLWWIFISSHYNTIWNKFTQWYFFLSLSSFWTPSFHYGKKWKIISKHKISEG